MVPEEYTKTEVEAALFESDWVILDEQGSFTCYQTHFHPGGDLVLDWSRGKYEWWDLRAQLEFQNVDPEPIYNRLRKGTS